MNLDAWEATFRERGLPVPPDGPREGVRADRLRKVKDERLGWREGPVDLPGLIAIDSLGMQRAGKPDAATGILIVGASVAWGADASTIENTYFATLVHELAELGGRDAGHGVRGGSLEGRAGREGSGDRQRPLATMGISTWSYI